MVKTLVKKPFYQLLSIHGFVRSGDDLKQIPLCFCIMSGKKMRHYKKVFQSIKDLLPESKVTSFVVDFEKGLWQGIRAAFETPLLHGCAFHFGQALWRKVQELGLQRVYQEHDSMYKLLRKVFALPLLPADDIPPSFAELQRRVDPEAVNVQSFLRYVEDTWIHNNRWTVDSWSIYGRSIRTNNDVEGWHNRMNRRARKGNLPFYLLITLLYKKAREIESVVRLLQEGKIRRHQKKQTTKVQGRLIKLWEKYGNHQISTNTLLKCCARLYGPC